MHPVSGFSFLPFYFSFLLDLLSFSVCLRILFRAALRGSSLALIRAEFCKSHSSPFTNLINACSVKRTAN